MRDVHVKWRLFSLQTAHFSQFPIDKHTHINIYYGIFSVKYFKRILLPFSYRKSLFKRHLRQYCAFSNTCRQFDVTWKTCDAKRGRVRAFDWRIRELIITMQSHPQDVKYLRLFKTSIIHYLGSWLWPFHN